MKNKKHPICYLYDVKFQNSIDYKKSQNVKMYDAIGKNKLTKGTFLYEYEYKPLLSEEDYNKLLSIHYKSEIFQDLYLTICKIYYAQYDYCIKWYIEKSRIKDVFDIEKEIQDLKLLKIKKLSCPLVKELNEDNLDDVDIFYWLQIAMKRVEINNITNAPDILYDNHTKKMIPPFFTDLGKDVVVKINNIAYKRIIQFLLSEQKKDNNKTTIHTYFELLKPVSTKQAYDILLKEEFIHQNTSSKDFNSVFYMGTSKINWIGSQIELARFIFYMFNDHKQDSSKAVCVKINNKYEIASNIFYIKNKQLPAIAFRNANRALENNKRKRHLLEAIKSLKGREVWDPNL
jgi:hypothetical protein